MERLRSRVGHLRRGLKREGVPANEEGAASAGDVAPDADDYKSGADESEGLR